MLDTASSSDRGSCDVVEEARRQTCVGCVEEGLLFLLNGRCLDMVSDRLSIDVRTHVINVMWCDCFRYRVVEVGILDFVSNRATRN